MALEDIYVVEDHQTYNGVEPLLNTYQFMRTTSGGSAVELAAAYLQDRQSLVEGIQGNVINHTLLRVWNLGDLTDFAEVPETGNTGVWEGEVLPPFNAVNFTLRAASRAVRPGSKRYCGLMEAHTLNGYITNGPYIAALDTLRAALSVEVESPNDATTYAPVVVKRVPYVTPSGKDAYRWPETDLELVAPLVTGALVNLKISHQVSRGNSR